MKEAQRLDTPRAVRPFLDELGEALLDSGHVRSRVVSKTEFGIAPASSQKGRYRAAVGYAGDFDSDFDGLGNCLVWVALRHRQATNLLTVAARN